jgi:hypothetical protein
LEPAQRDQSLILLRQFYVGAGHFIELIDMTGIKRGITGCVPALIFTAINLSLKI